MFLELVGVLVSILIVVITYFKWCYTYWKRRNVPYLKPIAPFGTMKNVFSSQMCFGELLHRQYEEGKRMGCDALGLFQLVTPNYLAINPDHIKTALVKDFDHFTDHGVYHNERDDPLSAHLFALEGKKWRNMRVKLSPTFTSGKMKAMMPLVIAVAGELKKAMEEICLSEKPFEAKELAGCFTTDVIGACGFGLNCNSFKNPDSEFRKHTKNVFKYESWDALKSIVGHTNPPLARFLRIRAIAERDSTFFMTIIRQTFELRKTNDSKRNDFVQLLIDLKDSETEEEAFQWTFEVLAAQAFLFFFAAYESSSITLTFCLYELSLQPHIQKKIKAEIDQVLKTHGQISYENLLEMKYTEQVIEETLRKYPPLPTLNRKCTRDYHVPDTDIVIEKGTQWVVSLMGLHYDADHFPDPYKFDPDRFSTENKKKIKPFTYLPFGDGPRICTGMRFAIMQIKLAIVTLLQSYEFSLNPKTVLPVKLNPTAYFLTPVHGIWLDVKRVE
ncbi:hypothetical protein FQR65_LT11339 [Abscondita terminalis]|nr:hypothetical protein FQR65_LT11339 [Abscondita terminalis]